MKRNKLVKRVISTAMAVTLMLGAIVSDSGQAYAAGGGRTTTDGNGIDETITAFTKDHPLVVLEIVPDVAYAEFGYFVSGEEPVQLEQLGTQDYYSLWTLFNTYDGSQPALSATVVNENGGYLTDLKNNDMFIGAVWGTDKIEEYKGCVDVISVSPAQLNANYKEYVDNAHLIYVNCGNSGAKSVYVNATGATVAYDAFSYENDLSADATMYIYAKAKSGQAAFMASAQDMQSIAVDPATGKQSNIEKLCWLFKSFDYEIFNVMYPYVTPSDYATYADYEAAIATKLSNHENFISVSSDDKLRFSGRTNNTGASPDYYTDEWQGEWAQTFFMPYNGVPAERYMDEGSIYDFLSKNEDISQAFNMFLFEQGGTKTWQLMFADGDKSVRGADAIAGGFYTFIGYSQSQNNYLRGKVWMINGDKSFSSSLYYVTDPSSDYNEGTFIDTVMADEINYDGIDPATPIDIHEYAKVDKPGDNFLIGNIIEHIIGKVEVLASIELVSGLKILEIQPVADYVYANDKDAVIALLGVSEATGVADMITVDGITINEFNGMTKDMISDYDMVIVGSNAAVFGGNAQYNAKASGLLYVTGDTVDDKSVKGNDLTDKAKQNFLDLADSGVPFILAEGVDTCAVIESGSNLYEAISAINGKLNVFKVCDLEDTDNGKYYKYNLRSVLNALGGCVVSNLTADASIETSGENLYGKVHIELTGKANTKYQLNVGYDVTGNGNYVYYIGSSVEVTTDGDGKKTVDLTISDTALSAVLADVDYYTVKVTAAYADASITAPYAYITGDGTWNVRNEDTTDDKVTLSFDTLRTTSVETRMRTMPETGISILQICPNSGNVVDYTSIAQNINDMTTYDVNVVTLKVNNFDQYIRLSDYEMVIVSAPLSEEQYGRLAEYIDGIGDGTTRPVVFTYGSINEDTVAGVRGLLGVDASHSYSNSTVYNMVGAGTWKNGSQPYAEASGSLDFVTNKAAKLNDGQVCEYPYAVSDTVAVAQVDAPAWYLNLEDIAGDDVIVWYTLDGNAADDTKDYFTYRGKDAANNYYMYSVGNVHYTAYGQTAVSSDETKLFVNLLVLALDKAYATSEYGENPLYDLD